MLNIDIVRKALFGAAIATHGELYASYGGAIPSDCTEAARLVYDHYDEFKQLIWSQLEFKPRIKKCFRHLVRRRLDQKFSLQSPILTEIFDENPTLEERFKNIENIPGVEDLCKEYRGSNDPDKWEITDSDMRDLLAEILAIDFLKKTNFVCIRKISRKDKPHVDILVTKYNVEYAVDVTRKKEIENWRTISFGNLEDCVHPQNISKIEGLIEKALDKKNDQFRRAINAETIMKNLIKTVAIKSSDYGFSACIEQAEQVAQKLLDNDSKWLYIDAIWLLPDIDPQNSRWILKKMKSAKGRNAE
jgi:hypothetical protein